MTEVVTALVYDARGGVEGARKFVEASMRILDANNKVIASETKVADATAALTTRIEDGTKKQSRAYENLLRIHEAGYLSAKKLEQGLKSIDTALQRGANVEEAARVTHGLRMAHDGVYAAAARSAEAAKANAAALTKQGAGAKLSTHEMTNLSFQMNDVITGLATGQRPMQVFLQQGGQIIQLFPKAQAAVIGTMQALARPPVLAVAALAAAIATVGARAYTTENQVRRLEVQLGSFGRSSGAASGLQEAERQMKRYGASAEEARKTTELFVKNARIPTEMVGTLGKMTVDAAAKFNITEGEAASLISGIYAKGLPAIREAARQFRFLTGEQRDNIETLFKQGRGTEAVNLAIAAMAETVDKARAKSITPMESAMHELSNAWDSILDKAAKSATFKVAVEGSTGALKILGFLMDGPAAQAAKDKANGTFLGINIRPETEGRESLVAADGARTPATPTVVPAEDQMAASASTGDAAAFDMENQIALAKEKTQAERDQIEVLGVAENMRDRKRVQLQAEREATELDLRGAARTLFIEAKVNALIAQQTTALRDQNAALVQNINFVNAQADALLFSNRALAAGLSARAKAEAEFKRNPEVDRDALALLHLREELATKNLDSSRAVDEARNQNAALANEMAANGNAALLERAKRQNEVNDLLREEYAIATEIQRRGGGDTALDAVKDKEATLLKLRAERDDRSRSIRGAAERKSLDDNLDVARTENTLRNSGASDREREKEIALLKMRQQLVREGYTTDNGLDAEFERRKATNEQLTEYIRLNTEAAERDADFRQLMREGLTETISLFQEAILEAKSFKDVLKSFEQLGLKLGNQFFGNMLSREVDKTFADGGGMNGFMKSLGLGDIFGSSTAKPGSGTPPYIPTGLTESADALTGAADKLATVPESVTGGIGKLVGQQLAPVVNVTGSVVNVGGANGSMIPGSTSFEAPKGDWTDTLKSVGDFAANIVGMFSGDGMIPKDIADGGYKDLAGGTAETSATLAKSGTTFADMVADGIYPAMHTGGIVGDSISGEKRSFNLEAVMASLPRYHGGGMVGADPQRFIRNDERLAVLQTGERVLNRRETKSFGANNSISIPLTVIGNATPEQTNTARRTARQIAEDASALLRRRMM